MLEKLKTLWHYLHYTCMTNCMSINLGGALAFLTLLALSFKFGVWVCVFLTFLIDFVIFTMLQCGKDFLKCIKDPQIISNIIGWFLGCAWICLLYLCFVM